MSYDRIALFTRIGIALFAISVTFLALLLHG